jgi:UDP-N-acetylmuramoyl-tripeptide--D-alanyl-D-alanine ligase
MEAKFELIESLPASGLAVFNADNEHSLLLSEGVKTPKKLVSIEGASDVWASDITVTDGEVSFVVHLDDIVFPARCHVSGKHNIINILACVCVAMKLGMSVQEIQKGISRLTMPDRTMKITRLHDTVIIDDTYNTNTDGIKSALGYMREGYIGYKKIVVFPGVLELGSRSPEIHIELGALIAKETDLFIISNTDFAKYLIRGARSSGNIAKKILVIEDPKKAVSVINRVSGKKVVLFESRGMEKALNALKEKK